MTKPLIKAPNAIDVHVGSRLRMRRVMLGMSQEKLGKALGITFQQVQKYEKGTNRMGASRLQEAADVLGVAAPFFFERAEGGPYTPAGDALSPTYIDDFVSSADGLRLAQAFMQIPQLALQGVLSLW
jgi:transcriptional regulator with XRE-family HTH domain